jgi:hypothetical protein
MFSFHGDVHTLDLRSAGQVRGRTIHYAEIRVGNIAELAPRISDRDPLGKSHSLKGRSNA